MFSVGQRIWHRDGKRSGVVLECDGGRVFIEQDNGAKRDVLLLLTEASAELRVPIDAAAGRVRRVHVDSDDAALARFVR